MKLPTLTDVESSNIAQVAHRGDALFVKFKGGNAVYEYKGVPASVHAEMMKAESIGKHFGAHVKGKFPHVLHAV